MQKHHIWIYESKCGELNGDADLGSRRQSVRTVERRINLEVENPLDFVALSLILRRGAEKIHL